MPRGKKNAAVALVETPPMESGAGNLSPEDLAAIRGEAPQATTGFLTATEMLTSGAPLGEPGQIMPGAPYDEAPYGQPTNPELDAIVGRMLSLEGRMTALESAMEKWADHMNRRIGEMPRHASAILPQVKPATPKEESAYFAENFKRQQSNETPYDGIQAWRDAGSPGLAQ